MARINDWGETLDQTVYRSKYECGLQIGYLLPGEVIQVRIGENQPGLGIEEDRIITAQCINPELGILNIVGDTSQQKKWEGRYASLGSFVFSAEGKRLHDDGLVRGLISQGNGVAIVLEGTQPAPASDYDFLFAEYQSLFLEGHKIF